MAATIEAIRHRPQVNDQNTIDLTWERCQEQALLAYRHTRPREAKAQWERGLKIAERHFQRGDPRLAASRTNHAFSLMRQHQTHQATLLFNQAILAWDEAWRWVALMEPAAEDGEGEPAPFDAEEQKAFYALIEQGKIITENFLRYGELSEAIEDDWQDVKTQGLNDVRRLFSAVLLMPTLQP